MTLDERQDALKKRGKEQRDRADALLRQQLSTEKGREFIAWLVFDLCGLGTPALNLDPALMALAHARAMVGGTLAKRAELADRQSWALLEHERVNRRLATPPLPEADDEDE